MIKLIGWLAVFAGLVACGWYGREIWSQAQRVEVRVAPSQAPAPRPKASPAKPAPKPVATVAAYRDPPERDNVGAGFTTQGIGYYDVRGTY